MINTDNLYVIETKSFTGKIKNAITSLMFLVGTMSFLYLLFWSGMVIDTTVIGQGEFMFKPLAQFLNPTATTIEMYKTTSLYLFLGIIPLFVAHYLVDKLEESIIENLTRKQQAKKKKEAMQAYLDSLKQYEMIKTYSICASIDYSAKEEIPTNVKAKLNSGIYEKIKNSILKIEPSVQITTNNVLIITSNNFDKFDLVYESILKILSKIKPIIEAKYGYNFIPSMTTDAFYEKAELNNIQKQHFEIQSFNFKNRACSTATFSKKYTYLKHKKYAGIPIGEYAYFGNNKVDTYELNIIHKNLNNTLSKM